MHFQGTVCNPNDKFVHWQTSVQNLKNLALDIPEILNGAQYINSYVTITMHHLAVIFNSFGGT